MKKALKNQKILRYFFIVLMAGMMYNNHRTAKSIAKAIGAERKIP